MRRNVDLQTTRHHATPLRRIGERGKARLAIAARLLRLGPLQHGDDEQAYFEAMLAAIGRLSEERRTQLRGQVDWIEGYELQERQLK